MLTTIDGIYENGQVKLDHQPLDIKRSKVKVIFEDAPKEKQKKRKLGILKGLLPVPEDFNEPLNDLEQFWS
jgi:predicted DNA-binding antitoxin AbrB/MazE fold protein